MNHAACALVVALLFIPPAFAADPSLRVDYAGFTVWLNCQEHAVFKFRYNAQRDAGSFPRLSTFRLDPAVPYACQPSSTNAFKTDAPGALTYERGHQVPANHLDYSELAVRQSNFMTNILPQTGTLNRGAWLRTEEIIECYRDQTELLVLGGALWGNTKAALKNDYFVGSHNIRTPESFWKVVIAGDGSTLAWLIPNDQNATTAKLDTFLIKPVQLELKAKVKLPEVPKA
jgi:endonuclease G, mitochondrial